MVTKSKKATRAVGHEYERLARTYDERWSLYIERTAAETLKRLTPRDADTVLDVGCGSGAVLEALESLHPSLHLAGVDLSPDMLVMAMGKVGPRTRLSAANAKELPFATNSFDWVVSTSALHYWREPERCIEEIARVLKPTGGLLITDWCDDYWACRLCDLFLRIVNAAHFKTYGKRECERLLESAAFKGIRVERYKISWLWGMMTAEATAPATR